MNTGIAEQSRYHLQRARSLPLALFYPLLMLTAGPAPAQNVIEEVLVTAQRRAESLTETPVSVTAITGDKLGDFATLQFQDITRLTSGLEIRRATGADDIRIRGIGTGMATLVQPRATLYVDEAIAFPHDVFLPQFDIARIEILRGPQGTLYGKASPQGTINVHSQDPSLEHWNGYFRHTIQSRKGYNTQFGQSIPLVKDVLGVRLAGMYDENNDQGIRHVDGSDFLDRTYGGRANVLWQPAATLELRLSANHMEKDRHNWVQVEGNGIAPSDHKAAQDVKGFNEFRAERYIFQADWEIGNFQLTSVSMHAPYIERQFIDTFVTNTAGGSVDAVIEAKRRQLQELRLSTLGNRYWDFMIGGYYYYNRTRTPVDVQTLATADIGGVIVPLHVELELDFRTVNEDWAAFMHHSFHLNERSTLIAGLRYSRDRLSTSVPSHLQVFIPGPAPVLLQESESNSITEDGRKRVFTDVTGTLKYQYHFTDALNAYITYDRGFRAAATNLDVVGSIPGELILYDPETSDSVEIGFKGRRPDGTLQFQTALYYQIYRDFQAFRENIRVIDDAGAETSFDAFVNAEEVRLYGAEAEITAAIAHHWLLFASAAYNDAEFDTFRDAPCNTEEPLNEDNRYSTCDLDGGRVNNSPRWSGAASAEYSRHSERFNVSWYVRTLWNFSAHRDNILPRERLGGFSTYDLFIGIQHPHARWEVSAWAKNITDKIARIDKEPEILRPNENAAFMPAAIASAYVGTGFNQVVTTAPRTFGVTVSFSWQ